MADRMVSLPFTDDTRLLSDRRMHYRLLVGALVLLTTGVVLGASYLIGTTTSGIWVVAGILGVLIGVLITIRPEFGAYILIAFVYLNLSSIIELRYGIPSLNKLLVALIFVGTIFNRVFLHRRPFSFDQTQRLILMYGLILLIASTRAEHQQVAWESIVDWLKDFAILIVIVQLSDRERVWRRMQWVLLGSAMLVAGLSVYQSVTGNFTNDFMGLANAPVHQITSGFDSTRVTGPLDDPNFYAQILLMTMPIALYRFFDEPSPLLKFVGGVTFVLVTLAAIFTYSRGAIFALLVVGVLVVWERRWNPYKTGAIILLVLMFVIPLLPVGYLDRVGAMLDVFSNNAAVQSESALTGRSSEMIIAGQMFLDNPLFGVGPDNYEKNYLRYSVRLGLDDRLQEREAHSLILETAAELGIIGVIVFFGVVVSALLMTRKARRQLREVGREDLLPWITGLQLGLVSYMVTSLFLHSAYIRYYWLLMGLVVSVGYVTDHVVRGIRANQNKLYTARPIGYFRNVSQNGPAVK